MTNLLAGGRADAAGRRGDACARNAPTLLFGVLAVVASAGCPRASRLRGGVRCHQADQAEGHGRKDGVDQSPYLASPGREAARRQDRALDDRGRPPNALYRRGFTKNSLPVGSEILVEGFRAKDGSLKGNGRELTFADGRRLFVGSSGTGAPKDDRER